MDLQAYAQIPYYEHFLKENNIEIPRLRGIRIMAEEEPFSEAEIAEDVAWMSFEELKRDLQSYPKKFLYKPWIFGQDDEKEIKKYGDEKTFTIFWNKIHGKKRKVLKTHVKRAKQRVYDCERTFNKYVGDPNVICIHARIGSENWHTYECEWMEKEPWFICKTDDPYDETYCNIYIRITPKE